MEASEEIVLMISGLRQARTKLNGQKIRATRRGRHLTPGERRTAYLLLDEIEITVGWLRGHLSDTDPRAAERRAFMMADEPGGYLRSVE